jgi:hypothetical protein
MEVEDDACGLWASLSVAMYAQTCAMFCCAVVYMHLMTSREEWCIDNVPRNKIENVVSACMMSRS